MKMIEINKQYKFNRRTFYQWLRSEGLIEQSDTGYIVGPNSLPGMETINYSFYQSGRSYSDKTQVIIDDAEVANLVEKYINSGLPNLYTRKRQVDILKEELEEATHRITFLEGQVTLLTSLLTK